MAGFNTHICVSSLLGAGYAGTLHTMYGVPLPTAALAGTLCGVAGMLPDLDGGAALPLREAMSFAAAAIPILFLNRLESLDLSRNSIVLISLGLYLFVRFGVAGMIRKFTVHGGMFHSIPAMLIFGGIAYLLTGGRPTVERYIMAGGVMGGVLSHLVLDEVYSIEFAGGRWRKKKSYGTALKLWGGSGKSNLAAYTKLAVVGMGVVGEPGALKSFVANRPQIAEAINIVTKLGQSDPRLAGQFEQLKNILGTLNIDPDDPTAPQTGGAWPSASAAPPNNQFPNGYPQNPAPASDLAPTGQYSVAPALPPQQLAPAAPLNNQRPGWQWPGANQSKNNGGQPFQNSYDTAQRPISPFTQ